MSIHKVWWSRVFPPVRQIFLLGNSLDRQFLYPRCNITSAPPSIARCLSSFRVRKRFYKKAGIQEAEGGFQITVDNKRVKTPAGNPLIVPTKPLAMAVAVEWNSQKETIKPENMHLTSLSNTVIDNPQTKAPDEQILQILEYLNSDTVCFFADEPKELVDLQMEEWKPLVEWFGERYRVSIQPTTGLLIALPDEAIDRLKDHLSPLNKWSLAGLEFAVETLKSFILAMALIDNRLNVEKAVSLSRLELEFQISRWGSVEWAHDLELMETRSRVAAAALFYSLNDRHRTLSTNPWS